MKIKATMKKNNNDCSGNVKYLLFVWVFIRTYFKLKLVKNKNNKKITSDAFFLISKYIHIIILGCVHQVSHHKWCAWFRETEKTWSEIEQQMYKHCSGPAVATGLQTGAHN